MCCGYRKIKGMPPYVRYVYKTLCDTSYFLPLMAEILQIYLAKVQDAFVTYFNLNIQEITKFIVLKCLN